MVFVVYIFGGYNDIFIICDDIEKFFVILIMVGLMFVSVGDDEFDVLFVG